jgi:ferritin
VLRFLYLHEWMHWYLKERRNRKSQAETACDRFALYNYRKRTVTLADADEALRRRRDS